MAMIGRIRLKRPTIARTKKPIRTNISKKPMIPAIKMVI